VFEARVFQRYSRISCILLEPARQSVTVHIDLFGIVERDLIRTRTAEGRSRAKAQGKHMGRPPSLTPAQKEAIRRRAQGATLEELARSYNVSRATISRLA
jgi:helix-turn-helix resolvase-like protein